MVKWTTSLSSWNGDIVRYLLHSTKKLRAKYTRDEYKLQLIKWLLEKLVISVESLTNPISLQTDELTIASWQDPNDLRRRICMRARFVDRSSSKNPRWLQAVRLQDVQAVHVLVGESRRPLGRSTASLSLSTPRRVYQISLYSSV